MATNPSNPFVQFVATYRDDPVRFAVEVLGITPFPWQVEALNAYAKGSRRISIRSGHGVGKSTFLGIVVWHHALFNRDQKTVVTAPTTAQLFDALWAEIKRMYTLLPEAIQSLYDIKSDRIELLANPAGNFIAARTSRAETPEAMQGVHSPGSVLLIGDEASGIPEPIFEAAAGSMSGHNARTLLCGNPVRTSGFFFDTHNKLRDMWWTMKVSCEDVPQAVSADYVVDMERRYGGRESNAFRVRVLGEFPLADAETVIPFEWVESAKDRDIRVSADTPVVWGLDVARTGNDRTALSKRKGAVHLEATKWWREPDLMVTVGRVKREYDDTPFDDRPVAILVDAIGLGAGVADRLRELGLPARAINVAESAGLSDKYRNLRAELWFKAREWFEGKSVTLCPDPTLQEELVAVKFKITSSGKYQIESKEDMKRSGRQSPDLADSFVLTFAHAAANAMSGSKGASSWSTPIRRKGGVGYA